MGKTVMLNEVEDLARERGWITMAESGHAGLVDRLLSDHLGPILRTIDPEAEHSTLTGLGALYAGARASERASLPRPFRPRPFARTVPQALTWSRGRTAS